MNTSWFLRDHKWTHTQCTLTELFPNFRTQYTHGGKSPSTHILELRNFYLQPFDSYSLSWWLPGGLAISPPPRTNSHISTFSTAYGLSSGSMLVFYLLGMQFSPFWAIEYPTFLHSSLRLVHCATCVPKAHGLTMTTSHRHWSFSWTVLLPNAREARKAFPCFHKLVNKTVNSDMLETNIS